MSKRAEQIAEVIQRELNNYLIKEAEPPRNLLITLTKVEVTNDLEHAFVDISILPINQTGTALNFLKKNLFAAKNFLRRHSVLRKLPEIHLRIDDFALKSRKIERELEKLE